VGSREALEVWSLPLALAAVLDRKIEVVPGRLAATRLTVDGRRLPIDEDGRLLLRFHGGEGVYRQHSYATVLASAKHAAAGLPVTAARPEEFRDKVVIVGANAAGLLGLRATSMCAMLPGYVIHAAALDNVLHGDSIRRPREPARGGALLLLGILCGVLVTWYPSLRGGALTFSGLAVVFLGLVLWAFGARGVWLDVVPPALALHGAYGAASGASYLVERGQRREAHQGRRARGGAPASR
jgi:adenylate cyclase